MTVRQIACFFMILGFCSSTTLAQISARPGPPDRYVSREILVFPRQPGQSPALVRKLRQQGFQVLAQAPLSGMIIAAVPAAGLELTMCQYLELWPEVLVAECNAIGESNQPVCPLGGAPTPTPCNTGSTGTPFPPIGASPCLPVAGLPNDPYFCYQWGVHNTGQTVRDRACSISGGAPGCWEQTGHAGIDIGVVEAWQRSTGSSAVTVAVFDSGIEYCNPDFDPARFFFPDIALTCVGDDGSSYPCCPPPSASEERACNYGPATDNVGHGTMVASVLAATPNNQLGLAGVDHACRVLSARVVSQSES